MKPQLLLALCAPLLVAGCRAQEAATPTAPLTVEKAQPMVAMNSAPAATMAPMAIKSNAKSYRVRGQVVEVAAPSAGEAFLVIKHENIPGFMRAMQMRLPLIKGADAKKVKPGDKIAFDMNADNIQISNIEMLPPSTALKLAK